MFSFGTSLLSSGENSLQRINEEELFQRISQPDDQLKSLCQQLKRVKRLSKEAYANLKRKLPFFAGAVFQGDHRKLENFASARYMVIDLDHCFQSEEQFATLRQRLQQDQRVMMMFVSPGGEGLKILFSLNKTISSTKQFSEVYRAFARSFAQEHQLDEWVDFKTHDATRVCFICADSQAWFNRLCEDVKIEDFESPFDLFSEHSSQKKKRVTVTSPPPPTASKAPLDKTTYKDILSRIKGRKKPAPQKVYVPRILELITAPINSAIEKLGFSIAEVRDIRYGKKWMVTHDIIRAETNVFYGKNGFSVVMVSKKGTHPEFNQLLAGLIENVIYQRESQLLGGTPAPSDDQEPLEG